MPTHLDLKANRQPLGLTAPLWRYIKLSTLLYMLKQERVYVPRLSTLQKGENFEGCLDLQDGQVKCARDQELQQYEAWLRRDRDKGGTTESWEGSPSPSLSDLWLRELAKRRCIWCWHRSEHESMAQWLIYGKEAGVAICSDAKSILKTFETADVVYGNVQYVHPGQFPDEASPDLPWHPYFLKHGSFEHEREVRFVLEDEADWPAGRPVKVAPGTMIKKIVISPLLPSSEATAVMDVVKQLGQQFGIKDVRVSGGQDVSNPQGRSDSTLIERAGELAADQWASDGPRRESGEPSVLRLMRQTSG